MAVKLIVYGDMLVRGVDLVAGDSASTSRSLGTVEAAAPLWMWGSLLIAGSLIGFGSMILRQGAGVFAAHLIGWVALWGIAVGVVTDVYLRAEIGPEVLIPSAVALVAGGVVTALVCHWSGWEYARLTTVGVSVAVAFAIATIHLDGLRNASILFTFGAVHALLAAGTAAALRQCQIEDEIEAIGDAS